MVLVVPSVKKSRIRGCRLVSSSKTLGINHRPVVPIIPERTIPVTSERVATTSSIMDSSSPRTRRARVTTIWPSSVNVPVARSMRVASNSRSNLAIRPDTLDWTVPRAAAADEKLPWLAMASTASSWRRSIYSLSLNQIESITPNYLHDEADTPILVSYRIARGTPPPRCAADLSEGIATPPAVPLLLSGLRCLVAEEGKGPPVA